MPDEGRPGPRYHLGQERPVCGRPGQVRGEGGLRGVWERGVWQGGGGGYGEGCSEVGRGERRVIVLILDRSFLYLFELQFIKL